MPTRASENAARIAYQPARRRGRASAPRSRCVCIVERVGREILGVPILDAALPFSSANRVTVPAPQFEEICDIPARLGAPVAARGPMS
jgi:hypothetical protein